MSSNDLPCKYIYYYTHLESVIGTAAPVSEKKKSAPKKRINQDFNVEYSKSGRAVCCGCQDKIVKVWPF